MIAKPALLALLLSLAAAGAVGAEPAPAACPAREGASLVRVLYLFATGRPDTYATCIYSNGAELSLPLAKGCGVTPVDVFHDGPPLGGMHECRETEPGRCRIACRQS